MKVLLFFCVCFVIAFLPKDKPKFIKGASIITQNHFLQSQSNCNGIEWIGCVTGGIPRSSPRFPNCCGNKERYCPTTHKSCIPIGCCPNGFNYYCQQGEKKWCCNQDYPMCGNDGNCYQGTCGCNGCQGPNPCQFERCDVNHCSNCCKNYGIGCSYGRCQLDRTIMGMESPIANITCN